MPLAYVTKAMRRGNTTQYSKHADYVLLTGKGTGASQPGTYASGSVLAWVKQRLATSCAATSEHLRLSAAAAGVRRRVHQQAQQRVRARGRSVQPVRPDRAARLALAPNTCAP